MEEYCYECKKDCPVVIKLQQRVCRLCLSVLSVAADGACVGQHSRRGVAEAGRVAVRAVERLPAACGGDRAQLERIVQTQIAATGGKSRTAQASRAVQELANADGNEPESAAAYMHKIEAHVSAFDGRAAGRADHAKTLLENVRREHAACYPNAYMGEDVWCQAAFAVAMTGIPPSHDKNADKAKHIVRRLKMCPKQQTAAAVEELWNYV